jgi:hypothetical protein
MSKEPKRSPKVDDMQHKLEHALDDLLGPYFTDDFPMNEDNAKYVLASVYHICGHIAAKAEIPIPEIVALATHESIEAHKCLAAELLRDSLAKLMEPPPPAREDMN